MKRILIILAAVVGLVVSMTLLLPKQHTKEATTELTFAMIEKDIENGAKLYDVRTAEEYEEGPFENAINWSLQELEAGTLPDVAKSTKIYLYCRSGNRSAQATSILKEAGFTDITDLGGLNDVKAMGGQLSTV